MILLRLVIAVPHFSCCGTHRPCSSTYLACRREPHRRRPAVDIIRSVYSFWSVVQVAYAAVREREVCRRDSCSRGQDIHIKSYRQGYGFGYTSAQNTGLEVLKEKPTSRLCALRIDFTLRRQIASSLAPMKPGRRNEILQRKNAQNLIFLIICRTSGRDAGGTNPLESTPRCLTMQCRLWLQSVARPKTAGPVSACRVVVFPTVLVPSLLIILSRALPLKMFGLCLMTKRNDQKKE